MEKRTLETLLPLIEKVTKEGKLKWSIDPSGGYLSHSGKYIINVFDRSVEAESGYGIRLVDANDNVIDYLSAEFPDEHYDILHTINEDARRSALNIDEALNSIAQNLISL